MSYFSEMSRVLDSEFFWASLKERGSLFADRDFLYMFCNYPL